MRSIIDRIALSLLALPLSFGGGSPDRRTGRGSGRPGRRQPARAWRHPDNLSYITGLGTQQPQWALHEDSMQTGRLASTGMVLYGIFDHPADFVRPGTSWLQTVIGFRLDEGLMEPSFQQWSVYETYVDIWTLVPQNEYTPWQTMAVPACVWGDLASRVAEIE